MPIPSPWQRPIPQNWRASRSAHFLSEKTRKDHGIVKWIEGDITPGQRVVIIDDVATTGGSTLTAVERAQDEGLEVVCAVVLVDRQEGGLENIRAQVPDARAIVTREELMQQWWLDHPGTRNVPG